MNTKIQNLVILLLVSTGAIHAMTPWQTYACTGATSFFAGMAGHELSGSNKKEMAAGALGAGALVGHWGCHRLSRAVQIKRANDDMAQAEKDFDGMRRHCLPTGLFLSSDEKIIAAAEKEHVLSHVPLYAAVKTLVQCKERSLDVAALAQRAHEKDLDLEVRAVSLQEEVSKYNAEFDDAIDSIRKDPEFIVQRRENEYGKEYRAFIEAERGAALHKSNKQSNNWGLVVTNVSVSKHNR